MADTRGATARVRVRDTRANVGGVDRSGINKMNAPIDNNESKPFNKSSKVKPPRPWDQWRIQSQSIRPTL